MIEAVRVYPDLTSYFRTVGYEAFPVGVLSANKMP